MANETRRTIWLKWVRSGIGFHRQQSEAVRSLGLRRLNQVVERPDNAQTRGLVAKVAHLVEVVTPALAAAWTLTPEYTVAAPQVHGADAPEPVPKETAEEPTEPSDAVAAPVSEAAGDRPAEEGAAPS